MSHQQREHNRRDENQQPQVRDRNAVSEIWVGHSHCYYPLIKLHTRGFPGSLLPTPTSWEDQRGNGRRQTEVLTAAALQRRYGRWQRRADRYNRRGVVVPKAVWPAVGQ